MLHSLPDFRSNVYALKTELMSTLSKDERRVDRLHTFIFDILSGIEKKKKKKSGRNKGAYEINLCENEMNTKNTIK